MALDFASVKDDVCRAVFGVEYADLDPYQQSMTTRFGTDAETRLGQYAVYWQMDSSDAADAPASWEAWLIAHAAMITAAVLKRDRYEGLRESERLAADAALNLFTSSDAKTGTPADQDPASLTCRMIYKHVLMHCTKRQPRIFPNIDSIDSAIHWAVNALWNRKLWKFREIPVTLTFDSTGLASVDPSISFGDIVATGTTRFYSVDCPPETLELATADDMAMLRATYPSETGRPQRFRFGHSDSAKGVTWITWPVPAAGESWEFTGTLLKAPPAAPSQNNATADFAQWPEPFRPVLKDLVLAKVLDMHGAADGRHKMNDVEAEIASLVPAYVARGEASQVTECRDVYGDFAWLGM